MSTCTPTVPHGTLTLQGEPSMGRRIRKVLTLRPQVSARYGAVRARHQGSGTVCPVAGASPLGTATDTGPMSIDDHRSAFIADRVGRIHHSAQGIIAHADRTPHAHEDGAGKKGVPLPAETLRRGDGGGRFFLGVCLLVHGVCILAHAVILATPLPDHSTNLAAPERGAERIQAPSGVTPPPDTHRHARSVLAHGAVEQRPSSSGS